MALPTTYVNWHCTNCGHENETNRKSYSYKEVQSVPKALKDAGARPGDKVSATPMGVMPGENTQQGAKKRDKIYSKELGAKMNPRTGKTIGNMRG